MRLLLTYLPGDVLKQARGGEIQVSLSLLLSCSPDPTLDPHASEGLPPGLPGPLSILLTHLKSPSFRKSPSCLPLLCQN